MEGKKGESATGNSYDYVIEKYNQMSLNYNEFTGRNFLSMGQTFLNMVNIHNCERIIDAGCGDGNLAVQIAL